MPFSTKVKADYVELINGELDSIPMERLEEFELIAKELENFITSPFVLALKSFFSSAPEKKPVFATETREQLAYVRYCLDTPKDFVKSAADYAEYQQILKERIKAKITEFRTFAMQEKIAYLEFQKEKHQGFEQKTI